jgi:hypothetical protein
LTGIAPHFVAGKPSFQAMKIKPPPMSNEGKSVHSHAVGTNGNGPSKGLCATLYLKSGQLHLKPPDQADDARFHIPHVTPTSV